jgi:restriction endonuclease S subunit
MKSHLSQIAAIDLGFSFRARVESIQEGNVFVIQMKDLSDEGIEDASGIAKVNMKQIKEHYMMRKGDLIFRSRGVTNTSVLLREDIGTAILAAPLIRIRIKTDRVLPEYLRWFINQKSAQAFFASRTRGSFQKMITKQSIEELEVRIPSLDRQQKIVTLAEMEDREQGLLRSIAKKRRACIEKQLTHLVKEFDDESEN